MSNILRNLRPPYPVYSSTPLFGGSLPSIDEIGPPDLRPSGLNPYYDQYRGARGRNIAGLGGNNMTADVGIQNYPNELDALAEADDVQGNGVFDPAGTQGNIHPDYGVFADHMNMPGYLVRDQFYQPSQVIDGTTGNPVMYVPGGAVAIDQSQLDTIRERQLLWELPPGVSPQGVTYPEVSDGGGDWIPQEFATAINGLGADAPSSDAQRSKFGIVAGFAIAGVAIGIFAATLMKK
jgi:hypothetical protein